MSHIKTQNWLFMKLNCSIWKGRGNRDINSLLLLSQHCEVYTDRNGPACELVSQHTVQKLNFTLGLV